MVSRSDGHDLMPDPDMRPMHLKAIREDGMRHVHGEMKGG